MLAYCRTTRIAVFMIHFQPILGPNLWLSFVLVTYLYKDHVELSNVDLFFLYNKQNKITNQKKSLQEIKED